MLRQCVGERTRDTHVIDRIDAVVAPGDRHGQPFQAILDLDQIAVMPVILAVLDVVVDDEDIDHRNDVEIALPRDEHDCRIAARRSLRGESSFINIASSSTSPGRENKPRAEARPAGAAIIPSPAGNYQLFSTSRRHSTTEEVREMNYKLRLT